MARLSGLLRALMLSPPVAVAEDAALDLDDLDLEALVLLVNAGMA
jgi:hypothetical protein